MVNVFSWGNSFSFEFLRATGTAPIRLGQAPAMGGVQSGIPVLAWPTSEGAYFQFLDLLGNPDTDPVAGRVLVTTNPNVTNLQVADALVAYGALWTEGNQIKLRGVAQEQGLVGQEITVGTGTSASLAAYSFDTGVPDPETPGKTIAVSGLTVAWIDTAGQIRVQRYQVVNDDTGHPGSLVAAGIDGQAESVAVHAVGDIVPADDSAISLGAGRDVKVQSLHTGDTLVTYIGNDNQIHARLFPPNGRVVASDAALNNLTQAEYDAVNALIATLGPIPAGANIQTVELGAGDFGIVWRNAAGGLEIRIFAQPPDTAAGDALPDGWSPYSATIAAADMPGFTGEFALTGLGEDNANLVISYTGTDGAGTGVFARVVDVNNIDGTPGSISVGSAAMINTNTAGDQKLIGLTGLISDRFMVSFVDADGTVLSRILDTRSPSQLLVGDQIRDGDANGVISPADRVRSRPDVIVGTNGDDVIIGDLLDPQNGARFDDPLGSDDELHGGLGTDILFGGGGFDIIDGGLDLDTGGRADPDPQYAGLTQKAFNDTAIFQGDFLTYNVFINGDGSYSVLDARFDDGANIVDELADGTLNVDGHDIVSNVETLQFLNGDITKVRTASYATNLADAKAALATPGNFRNIDTSTLYQLKTQDQRLTGNVAADTLAPGDTNPAGIETVLTPVGWDLNDAARAANGFAVANTAEAEGRPQVAATIDGFVTSWEIAGTGTASSLKMQVYDALGQPIPVDGTTTAVIDVTANARAGSAAIAGTGVGTAAVWIDNTSGAVVLQAYDLGNLALGSALTVRATPGITDVALGAQSLVGTPTSPAEQVTVVWVENGAIFGQRLGFPLDAAGVEGPPVALGRDGNTGGINTPFQIAASGSLPSVAGLHDGEIAITYVSTVAGVQTLNVMAIRPDGTEVTSATDATVLRDIAVTGTITTPPALVSAGEGDIVLGWTENVGGAVATKLAIYRIANGWGSPEIMTLGIPADAQNVNFAVAGEDGIAIVVTWREADGDVVGQRFEYGGVTNASGQLVGVPVGDVFLVGSGVNAGASGAAGLLDGRVATIYGNANADIQAHLFDTRDATEAVIGRDAGGPRDFVVGTVFDDIIDTRDREDTIYGALGNDILIGGVNDDSLYGGAGNDDLVGGTGNDALEGNDGDDLLMGGYGRDIISGGDGIDTLSYQGEQRAVVVDLVAGTVRSDAAVNGVTLPDAATTVNGAPAGYFTDAGLEDVLGQIIEIDHEAEIFQFVASNDIENVIGGYGNDTLLANDANNVLRGNAGDDIIDGRGGVDIAVFSGNRADYTITVDGASMRVVDNRGVDSTSVGDILNNVEVLQFANEYYNPTGAAAPIVSAPVVLAPLAEDTTRIIRSSDLLLGAIDPNGDPLVVRNLTVDRGTLTANPDGTWTYTPLANDDTGAVFSYQISDGLFSTPQTASLDLTPVNDLAATGVAVLAASNEDTARIITRAELLQGVVNPDGLALTVGNLSVNRGSIAPNADGTWTYTPLANDDTGAVFSFTVTDGTTTLNRTATLDLLPVNDLVVTAPAVLAASNEDTQRVITAAEFLQGAFDADGNALTVQNVTVDRGTVVRNANGTWTFTPAANDDTSVVFSYQVTDGIATLNQTATLDLLPVNDAATGTVSFTLSEPTLDQVALTATNTLQDTDGLVSVSYQWQSSTNGGATWTNIANATGATYSPAAAQVGQLLRVTATARDSLGGTTTVASTETAVIGSALANTLSGTAGVNFMAGLAGADILTGNGGNDQMFGGSGNDQLSGSAGNDLLAGGNDNDTLNGDDGIDVLLGGAGVDTLNGGAGDDILLGEDGNDILNGDSKGAGGADILVGGNGADNVNGGDGNDTIMAFAGDGNDTYNGGNGVDTLLLSNLTGGTTVNLGAAVTVQGVAYAANTANGIQNGVDSLASIENVVGGSGNDTIIAAANIVNILTGGAGADSFIFASAAAAGNGLNARDQILDFTSLQDFINVRAIDASTLGAGDQNFTFIGERGAGAALAGGQLGYRYETVNGVQKTIVEGNIAQGAADTTVDFQIELQGRLTLTATDFVL